MRDRILAFLNAVDEALAGAAPDGTLEIYHIGRSALVWEYDYLATTADFTSSSRTAATTFSRWH